MAAHSGMLLVLDAVRYGMQSATLRFARRGEKDRGGLMFKADEFIPNTGPMRPDYQTPTNADMRLIEAAPDLYAACERVEDLLVQLEAGLSFKGPPSHIAYTSKEQGANVAKSAAEILRAAIERAKAGAA